LVSVAAPTVLSSTLPSGASTSNVPDPALVIAAPLRTSMLPASQVREPWFRRGLPSRTMAAIPLIVEVAVDKSCSCPVPPMVPPAQSIASITRRSPAPPSVPPVMTNVVVVAGTVVFSNDSTPPVREVDVPVTS
jgi:hypothetical protein